MIISPFLLLMFSLTLLSLVIY